MSDKKHIDRIFQEKLKDFEASPNPELWTKIQNELNIEDNQPKKVFPIWLRLASVAAVLAVLFTIGYFAFDNELENDSPATKTVDTNSTPMSDQDNLNNTSSDKTNLNSINSELTDNPETSTANFDESEGTKDAQNKSVNNANSSKSAILNNNNNSNKVIANTNGNSEVESLNNKEKRRSNAEPKVANTFGVESPNNTKANASVIKKGSDNYSETASNNPNSTNNINKVSSDSETGNTRIAETETNNGNPELDTNAANRALKNENTKNAIALNAMKGDNPHNEKEKEESLKVGDSLFNESPSIEEAIAQAEELNEKEEEKEKLVNRWQVYANVAPVYYNSLGRGSHIDDQFVSNSKSGETNMSYGVSVSYALSKKLAVRSGINSLNLSYDTDNVILYENPSNSGNPINPMRNIDLAPENQGLNAFSGENIGFQSVSDLLFDSAISQRLSYYEVPVELEYKLINKRFGVNLIGGVSTFFLNNNEVYSEFEEYTTYIGEANNVNNVSFSTNLGLGMNYKFSEKFKFNLEPTFKYQLNAFSNTSGNFRPYIIGVYTGFSYKF